MKEKIKRYFEKAETYVRFRYHYVRFLLARNDRSKGLHGIDAKDYLYRYMSL